MAEEFVESNVFQIPNLVQAANQQQRIKKRDEFRTLGYLDKYKQINGKYLPGHKPLVQERWQDVVKKMDAVAVNDTPATRRALSEAYTVYGNVAGNGQFLAQEHAKERKYLSENADKLAISVGDAVGMLDSFRDTRITEEQMEAIATNPSSVYLPRGYKSKVLNFSDQGRKLRQLAGDKVQSEWYDANGNLLLEKASAWADEWAKQNYTEGMAPEMISQVLVADNLKGTNGQLSIEEFADIRLMPEEEKKEKVAQYIQRSKENFLRNLGAKRKVSGSGSGSGSSSNKVLTESTFTVGTDELPIPSRPLADPDGYSRTDTEVLLASTKPIRLGDGSYAFGFGVSQDGVPITYVTDKIKGDLKETIDALIDQEGDVSDAAIDNLFDQVRTDLKVVPATRRDILGYQSAIGSQYKDIQRQFMERIGKKLSENQYQTWLKKLKK